VKGLRKLIGLLFALGTCAPTATELNMPISATLTASAPEQDFDVISFVRSPGTLAISASQIVNPLMQAFTVVASVLSSGLDGGLIAEEIGRVTPYPADRPGTFMLSVPPAARQILVGKQARLRVRLSLAPVSPERPLTEPIGVTFSRLVWH